MATIGSYRRGALSFDVDDSGGDGPLVVLLHGFPQTRRMWRSVTPALVEAGYRVIAPDQRGYSPGARPRRRRDYVPAELAADVLALADSVGAERFHVVGHDWGGVVAWQLGATCPQRLHSVSVLSTPHPAAMARAMLRSNQLLKSWYMLSFQIPVVTERFLRSGHGQRFFAEQLRGSGLPADEVAESLELVRSEAATPALNWYRALLVTRPGGPGPVSVPTLFLWGAKDLALGRTAAALTRQWVTGTYTFCELTDANHWMVSEEPDAVTAAVLDHVRSVLSA